MFKRRLNLLQQFSLLSFLCILLLSLTLGFVISHLLTQNMLDGEWHDTAEVVQNHIRQRSLHNLFTDPQLGQEPQRYQEALSYLLSLHEVVRVKVWDRAATVRWADDERLIGRRFPENRELQEALGGKVAVKLKELRKAEHAYERERFRKLAEVYVPIFAEQNPEEVIGVLEVYKVPARLFATIHRGKTTVWIISLTGGLLLYLSLFWIFRASSRTQIDLKRSLQEHSDRLEQEVAGRTQDLSLLFQTARQAVSTLNIDEILPTILRSAADLLNCRASSLRLLDRGTNLLRLAADHNLNAEFKQRGHIVLDQGVMGRVALEGQPVTVEDVETDPLYHHKAEALQAGIRSIAIVPLQAEGTIIGVLSVYDRKPRRFSKAEIASLTEFANLAALAIEKARLHEQTLQGKVHLSTILEINKKIGTTTEISDLLHTISDEAARLLRVDGVGFRVVEGDRLVSAAKSGVAHQVMLQPTIQVGESLSGQAAAENHPIIVSDVGAANTWAREHWTAAIREGIQSAMFVPVQIGGRVIGVLNIYAKRNREFTQSDVDLATAFADQAAIAIENARLYDKVRERALKLHGLAELAKFVTSAVEPQRVFDHIAKAASQLLQADLVRLWTTDEAARELTIQASHGSADLRSTPHIRILIGQGVIGSLWERRRAEFIPDLREDARWLNRNFLESTGLVSFAGVPMVIEGKVLGVLSIFSRELRNFTQLERELIQVLADHAAIALEKARLLQGTIRQNQELATLHTIASTVNQTLHLDALLEVALDKVQEVTGKPVAFIRTLDRKANELVLRGHRGLSPEYVQATPTISVGVGGTGWVLQEKTSLYIPDVSTDPRLSRWLHFMEGEWSYFGVPLMTKGEVIGTLSVASRRRDDFTPEDQRLIEAIAGPIGVAVENANLYQDLHDYSATLEEKVRERTQELEIVNQHKSEFLATMSHELRTPLNAIIGFCELLTDQLGATVSDRHQRYLSNIHTSGRHLLDLINGILDLSKVESGKMDLHYEEVPLAELIQQVFAGVGPQAQAKTLAFSWQVEDELDRVSLDAGKLKQILYNLVGNAIKFTPDGGSVTVTAKRVHGSQFMVHGRRGTDHEPSTLNHEPPAELLEISVADTGIGIKPEDQTRVFEPFQQIETSLGRKYPGTGLGLALTRKLVELHGGEIRVESTPGQGSTFTFTLALPSPVPPSGRRPEAPAAKPRPVETSEETAGDPARPLILVVEDDPKAIDLMVSYLQEGGYRVAVARNGEEALAQAKALHPLAITLDVLFPTVEGWHILEQLKAAPETQGIPVVVVSIVDDRPKGLQLGATEYLVKPVTRKGLLAALARQGVPSPDLQEIRVLAIDDDPVILDLFKGLLHMQGVSLLTATNGADGIRLAHSRKPDLIILDLMMPGMSGFEVLERLRADPTTAATPIFICSAKILTPEERDLLQEQAQRILQKGVFSPSDLLAEIATIRGRQGKHRSKGMRTRC